MISGSKKNGSNVKLGLDLSALWSYLAFLSLDEWKKKLMHRQTSLVIARPVALLDPYAAIAALDEVVNVKKEKVDERTLLYEILQGQCRTLLSNPWLQQVLIKLVASEEEAEGAKVIANATKPPVPVNQGSFTGRTRKAPYQRGGTNLSPRSPSEKRCWVCGKAELISSCTLARTSVS